jgi:hypothetical protein
MNEKYFGGRRRFSFFPKSFHESARLIDGTGRPAIENGVMVIAGDTVQQVF